MNNTEKYSIRDIEKLSGIKAHTIRVWEKRYGIIKPRRSKTNIRNYSNDDLKEILNISLLNKNGVKISAIAGMSLSERADYLSTISLRRNNSEGAFEKLLLSMMELDEIQFNEDFLSLIIRLGFEKTFIKVIFPFFERIGVMWQAGAVNPAQEHFFSNMIRQKLIAATDALQLNRSKQKVLLFLPAGELHEIALLFYNYAFRARGYQTIYLGQAVPLECIASAVETSQPDYIVTGMTSSVNSPDFDDFLKAITKTLSNRKIFYTGPIPENAAARMNPDFLTLKDLRALLGI